MSFEIELTPKQSDFYQLDNTYRLFVAGYGAGKSMTLIISALTDLFETPGANIAVYSPTYDLNSLNLAPRFQEILTNMNMRPVHNKQRGTISIPGSKYGQIIYRTMVNPERIIAYEVYRSHIDELDTLPADKAEKVWNKVVARNRQVIGTGANRVSVYTTPEGFKFCYNRWIKNKNEKYSHVSAPTYSNPHNPPDYVENLRASYPPELVEAYINGQFVNLTSGSVYYTFDRDVHDVRVRIKPKEPIHIGMDFNIWHMAAAIFVHRMNRAGEKCFCLVDELVDLRDTPDMIEAIYEKYVVNGHPVFIYPDATGKKRSSVHSNLSDIKLLKQAGFTVRTKSVNPFVRDRIASVNKLLYDQNMLVDTEACPLITEALEQQVYDKNGTPDKSGNLDHRLDALGYHCYYHSTIMKSNVSVKKLEGV